MARKKRLIDIAKDRPVMPGDVCTQEMLEQAELMIAWLTGEVQTSDVQRALELKHVGSVHTRAGTVLRQVCRTGHVEITKTKKWGDR